MNFLLTRTSFYHIQVDVRRLKQKTTVNVVNHTTLLTRLIMTHILTHCLQNHVVKFKDLV